MLQDLGYYNGEYGPLSEMKVPMLDRAGYFGDGIYEATYVVNGHIYGLEAHLDRFYNSAGLVRMKPDFSREELTAILQDMIAKVEGDKFLLYWQLTRGTAKRIHNFPDVKPNLWIMITPGEVGSLDECMKVITRDDTRFLHCNIKTLNLLPSVLTFQDAVDDGCDEVILHRNGRVTECSHSNVHILKNGIFYTAPADQYILPGTTRARLIQVCKRLGVPVSETPYTLDDLMNADEIMITSVYRFCTPVIEIDGKPVGGKAAELLKKLQWTMKEDFDREMGLL